MTDQIEARVIPVGIEEEFKTSYLDYSMSFILSGALPDGRDGLKPSKRRILVAMNDLRPAPKNVSGTSGNYDPARQSQHLTGSDAHAAGFPHGLSAGAVPG